MSKVVHRKKRLSSFKLIVLGFAAVIFVGALLLMLPVSSVSGTQTPFHEALFTSVSAVCVTGLVVQDTGSYWSSFGQAVILLLIQTGGLGVITVAVSFAIVPRSAKKNLPTIVDTFRCELIIFLISAAIVKIHVKPIAKMKMHQKIVLTVLSPAKNSIILTFSPLYVTSVIPDIAEKISISPSTSFRSHRKRSKHNC